MKFYYAFVSILVCVSLLLIQPQLTAIPDSDAIAITKRVTVPSESQSLGSELIIKREIKTYPVLIASDRVETPTHNEDEAVYTSSVLKAKRFFIQGNDKYDQGDYEGALVAYTKAISYNSNYANIYNNRGLVRYKLGDNEGAIEDYDQALRINANNEMAYFNRGLVRAHLKDYKQAVEDFNQALRINPDDAKIYIHLSHARAKLGDLRGAFTDYNQAKRLNPELVAAYKNRERAKDTNPINSYSAEQKFQITLLVSIILCLLWIISISFHEFGHAIVAYLGGDKSVKQKGYLSLNPLKYINPLVSIILPGLFFLIGEFPLPGAAVYIERQQLRNRLWQSAVSAAGPLASFLVAGVLVVFLRVSLAWNCPYWLPATLAGFISLQFFFVLFNLIPIPPLDGYGIIEAWLPNKLQAKIRKFALVGLIGIYTLPWLIPSFGMVLAVSGFEIAQWFGVTLTLAADGFKLFNRWYCTLLLGAFGIFVLMRQPQLIWNCLGFVLLSQFKKYEQALTAVDKAIAVKPNDSWAWILRSTVLGKLERYEEAIAACDRAIELNPNSHLFWSLRAWVLEKLERYEEESAAFNKVIELKPDDAWVWGQQGWVLEKLERYEEALAAFDKSIELKSKDAWVWRQRGWVLEKLKCYEQALVNYNKAIDLQPDNTWVLDRRDSVLEKIRTL
ncbi:tetratricopeptide repeat protein [Scytonema sp. UIC 10036]|uniref:tetratricopeptide repeat protein n=1 Tax=Scytonema sp. UIC 10036 TaxID=2304196 RepID=UPI0012DABA98|nr:tetratricopeptide repeat protein [Scytonema sp. UIC 10036]MUG96426.1 tetratricopeptide repeat protein [Scytonema sp. UIC 10036]